jgi:hypothetical protein
MTNKWSKPSGGRREFLDKVESPNGEGPRDRDCLKFLRGDVLLFGKELASLTSSHNVLRVFNRGRLVKPLSKGITHQSIWRCMVVASPQVDILQEVYPVFCGYAPLQDSARASVMDFIISHNIGFSSPMYSIGFIPINREDAMSQIVDEFLCLVWVRACGPGDDKHAWLRGS